MIGGVRETFFFLNPQNPFDQTCTLEIQPNGALLINAGLRLFWGLSLVYGESPGGQDALLNLNLTPYDRFRLDIDSVDVGLSLPVVVFSGNGNSASAIVSIPDNNSRYDLDIPFTNFTENPGSPIDWSDIDKIAFVFQSGSAVSGDDFAIRAIRVTGP